MNTSETKQAWAVIGNTDLTEGRGTQFFMSYHWLKASAIAAGLKKYIMGSDCPVQAITLYKHGSWWYGPVLVRDPTEHDKAAQKLMDKAEDVLERAKTAGITKDDLELLRYLK